MPFIYTTIQIDIKLKMNISVNTENWTINYNETRKYELSFEFNAIIYLNKSILF